MGYFAYFYGYLILLEVLLVLVLMTILRLKWPHGEFFNLVYSCVKILMALCGLFVAPWIARHAARRRVEFKQGFLDSLVGALGELRLGLSMLPLVGHWFQSVQTWFHTMIPGQ